MHKYKSPPPSSPHPNKCTCIWEYILRVKQCNKNYQYSTDLAVSSHNSLSYIHCTKIFKVTSTNWPCISAGFWKTYWIKLEVLWKLSQIYCWMRWLDLHTGPDAAFGPLRSECGSICNKRRSISYINAWMCWRENTAD